MALPEIDILPLTPNAVGEGILWCEHSQSLWWVDIRAPSLHRFWPETGRSEHWEMPQTIGCLALTEATGIIVALKAGLHLFDPESGALSLLTSLAGEPPGNRPNDGAVSRSGRFFVGTMPEHDRSKPTGQVHRLDGTVARPLLGGLHITNGLAFSPDDRTAYLSDSWPDVQTIWAFDHDPEDGALSGQRLFFDCAATAGRPDGACVDTDGCYWMAGVGGSEVLRITPKGDVDRRIPLPVSMPTKPCFGGPDLRTLFITSIGLNSNAPSPDGRVIAIDAGFQGVPEARCAVP
ncbi:sugar lactone lactonase YvrE [Aliiruegeria haliotis]|uniref:Sugar lactone lactonase YvrE n=1 Tax=Aliiruegeria haliotis TaxID=1280846 RepID=A0A2T0RLX8_9RHOB|nr:SMP-30/gluconolactonase/LRE family protein [Aliiruegeria haliotis]PRY22195.1 sugar lactone lactonase YvrE [Aliiruegeria haliotis]